MTYGTGRGRHLCDAPGYVMPNGSIIATDDPQLRVAIDKWVRKAWREHDRRGMTGTTTPT